MTAAPAAAFGKQEGDSIALNRRQREFADSTRFIEPDIGGFKGRASLCMRSLGIQCDADRFTTTTKDELFDLQVWRELDRD
jgi:hypothetical protein